MNHRYGIIFLFSLITVISFAEDTVHVVEKGETVYSISRFYRVSPEVLMKYNDIADASKLQIGRRLKIPAAPAGNAAPGDSGASPSVSSPPGAGYTEYRAVKNDTLYSIARQKGLTLQALLDFNGFTQNHILKVGELVKIPRTQAGTGAPGAAAVTGTPGAASPAQTRTEQSGAVRQTAAKAVDASLRWPIKPKEIAYMTGKLYGVALVGERSESITSLTQGTVVSAGPYRGFGRVVIVQVTGGYLYVYGGCESLSVKEGDRIGPGTELGKLGIDAVSEKPQLFFLVYRGNAPMDPAKAPRA
ncbi:MAG: LysM peptidoglycan-binding domain-containing protein [Spirochaetaceae bacterium]|jgi:murein DD-endopeptidase MepM/ murein hydrolase activator NlpD|nr:LysM peptidoglycan-binding domain-containing protein [Spirochaetaceae bacterium]